MTSATYRLCIAGENAFVLYFEQRIAPDISAQVQQACSLIRAALGKDLIELLPSYASVLVQFNALNTDHATLQQQLEQCLQQLSAIPAQTGKLIELPVYYSEQSGPDLRLIAEAKGISIEDVITRHQQQRYRVYAIGFAPGFAYLGEVDPLLQMPRHSTPRPKVPRGAVAIADRQTAVYPSSSPGGWNLIGLCPTPLFTAGETPPIPFNVGDEVQFFAINKTEFFRLGGEL